MRHAIGLVFVAGCGMYTVDDVGTACFFVPEEVPGALEVEVTVFGGENGPFEARCTLEAAGDVLVLRSEADFQRDRTPFAQELIARTALATCAAPVDAGEVTVVFGGAEVIFTVPGDGAPQCFRLEEGELFPVSSDLTIPTAG